MEKNAVASPEGSGGIVEELRAVVGLKTAHRRTELCVSISYELNNVFVNIRFMAQGKNQQ
jgi:hypothetical protein